MLDLISPIVIYVNDITSGISFFNLGDYTLYFLVNNLLNLYLKHFNEFIGGRFAKLDKSANICPKVP